MLNSLEAEKAEAKKHRASLFFMWGGVQLLQTLHDIGLCFTFGYMEKHPQVIGQMRKLTLHGHICAKYCFYKSSFANTNGGVY